MTTDDPNVHAFNPLKGVFEAAQDAHNQALEQLKAAQALKERTGCYLEVLSHVRRGGEVLLTKQNDVRGFFVRSLVQAINVPCKTFMYMEFYIPEFSEDPVIGHALPIGFIGSAKDFLRRACSNSCGKDAVIAGVLSPNSRGYHGQASTVTFFALCFHCQTAACIDSGAPADGSEQTFDRVCC